MSENSESLSPRTYTVRTYGCQMNEHDSERIAGLLEADGLTLANTDEEAYWLLKEFGFPLREKPTKKTIDEAA